MPGLATTIVSFQCGPVHQRVTGAILRADPTENPIPRHLPPEPNACSSQTRRRSDMHRTRPGEPGDWPGFYLATPHRGARLFGVDTLGNSYVRQIRSQFLG